MVLAGAWAPCLALQQRCPYAASSSGRRRVYVVNSAPLYLTCAAWGTHPRDLGLPCMVQVHPLNALHVDEVVGTEERVQALQAENLALRRALSRVQGVPPEEVTACMSHMSSLWQCMALSSNENKHCSLQVVIEDADATSRPEGAGRVAEEQKGGSAPASVSAPPEEVSLEAIESGIRWPDPIAEPAFWERPPRDVPLSNSEAPPFPAGIALSAVHKSSRRTQAMTGMAHAGSTSAPGVRDQRQLHVVHMTAEMAPIAKVLTCCILHACC